jgi:adenylosuccinate synthase
MPVTVIVGLQWGDEGKGRIVDLEAKKADLVARFNAGPNAGHTIVIGASKFVLHLVPAGVFQPTTTCLIANGTVVDPFILANEIAELQKIGVSLEGRLWISPRCHLILPFHRQLDRLHEAAKGSGRTGTTGRGIGPVHADKVSYLGLRVGDLLHLDTLRARLDISLGIKNRVLVALGGEEINAGELWHDLQEVTAKLAPYIRETYPLIQDAIGAGRNVLMAGANGTLLDNDFGTYPYCTAATTISAGVGPGAGIAPRHVTHVVGVLKAYQTRVGSGPFPTELTDETGDAIRKAGAEYGSTTGRPRRCGWFDGPMARFAAALNGCDRVALTKLDVLDALPVLRLATAYRLDGNVVTDFPLDAADMARAEMVYEDMPGWQQDTTGARRFSDLPLAARRYVERIEELTGVPITQITVGPERDAVMARGVEMKKEVTAP